MKSAVAPTPATSSRLSPAPVQTIASGMPFLMARLQPTLMESGRVSVLRASSPTRIAMIAAEIGFRDSAPLETVNGATGR